MDIDNLTRFRHNLSSSSLKKIEEKTIDPEQDKALKEACAGFEAILMNSMVKSMKQSLPGNALFKESNAGNIYRSMQDQHLAEHLSSGHSSLGIKEYLYEQLK